MSRRRAWGRAVVALSTLLATTPARGEWVDWIADAELATRFDSNLNQAEKSSEQDWDVSYHPSLTWGRVYQLAERTRVAATTEVAGELYSRFAELDGVAGEGRLALWHKLGLGDAPWVQAFVGGGYHHVDAAQRRGPRFATGFEIGSRLWERFDATLSYRFTRRYGQDGPRVDPGTPDDVFDQRSHEVALVGSFLASENLLVSAGFGYRRGDFESNAHSNRMAILAQTDVEAVARDSAFGGWVYRVVGNGYAPFASLSYALGDHWSIDAGYRFRYAEGRGLDYRSHGVSASVLFRY